MDVYAESLPRIRRLTRWCCVTVLPLLMTTSEVIGEPPERRSAASQQRTHPLTPALRVARSSLAEVVRLRDYQAVFTKREIVAGKLQPPQTMLIKHRPKPMSVYLKFIQPHAGREVIYFHGRNGGNILVHEAGVKSLVGTISIAPNSPRALSESRYPITRIGMQAMLEGVIDQWDAETKYGETQVRYYPNAKLGEIECRVIQSLHPRPRKQFRYHMTRLYLDKKTNLPVRLEQFGFPTASGAAPPLIEQYTYTGIRTNVGLADIDFDTKNPRYRF